MIRALLIIGMYAAIAGVLLCPLVRASVYFSDEMVTVSFGNVLAVMVLVVSGEIACVFAILIVLGFLRPGYWHPEKEKP